MVIILPSSAINLLETKICSWFFLSLLSYSSTHCILVSLNTSTDNSEQIFLKLNTHSSFPRKAFLPWHLSSYTVMVFHLFDYYHHLHVSFAQSTLVSL